MDLDLKNIRKKYTNLKQKEFAKELGFSPARLNKYENGREPSIDVLIKISDYLGVSIDTLLGREKKETSTEEVEFLGTDQRAIAKLASKLDDAQASQVYNYMLFVIDQKNQKYENYDF